MFIERTGRDKRSLRESLQYKQCYVNHYIVIIVSVIVIVLSLSSSLLLSLSLLLLVVIVIVAIVVLVIVGSERRQDSGHRWYCPSNQDTLHIQHRGLANFPVRTLLHTHGRKRTTHDKPHRRKKIT